MDAFDALMNPRSVAVVGASEDPARIGGRPLRYLREFGFPGPFYPVNPARPTVQGVTAYARVTDIPGPVDLAIIAVPAEAAVAAIRDCAAKGARGAVVFSGGFAELGAAGRALQAEMTATADAAGMAVIGPNCIGCLNKHARLFATFLGITQPELAGPRSVALASQSGGYASQIMNLAIARGLSVDHVVTTGNECNTGIGAAMLWLARSPDVRSILAYVEGVRDPAPFMEALRLAQRQRKPVVVIKVGTTAAGAEAAASHTDSLAGEDSAYDAVLHAYGAYRAQTTEEAIDVIHAAVTGPLPRGRRLAVASISGGVGVQLADQAALAGLVLPRMPDAVQARVRAILPGASPQNPVDITAQVMNQPALIAPSLEAVAGSGAADVLVAYAGVGAGVPLLRDAWLDAARRVRTMHPDCLLVMSVVAPTEVERQYAALGCPVFTEPAHCIRAAAALASLREGFERPPPPDAEGPVLELPPGPALDEVEAKRVLAAAGVALPRERHAAGPEEAAAAAEAIGGAVALKIVSADLPHKSELGGVRLGLRGGEAVREAAVAMAAAVAAAAPGARQNGFLVSEMLGGGVECIVGIRRDALFGPVVVVGLGGVATELLRDVAVRLAPVTEAEAEAMLAGLRCAPLLHGYRGRPRADVGRLAAAISALSHAVAANPRIRTLEVNPILALPDRAVALDAVVELAPAPR